MQFTVHIFTGTSDALIDAGINELNALVTNELQKIMESSGIQNPGAVFRLVRKPESELCHICLDNIKKGPVVTPRNSCVHEFHVACIKPWIDTHNTCPVCRTVFS